jgi:hypothetical protein
VPLRGGIKADVLRFALISDPPEYEGNQGIISVQTDGDTAGIIVGRGVSGLFNW